MNEEEYSLLQQERLNKNTGILFCATWVMTLLFFIQEPLMHGSSLSAIIWVPSVIALLIFSVNVLKHIKTFDFLVLFFLFAQVVIVAVATRVARSTIAVLTLVRYFTLLISVMFCSRIRINKKAFDFIFVCAMIIACLLVVYCLTPIATKYEASRYSAYGYTPDYYVFNFSNPNTAAFYILGIFCTIMINLPYRKRKIILFALMAACAYMIYRTGCRSCLLVAAAVMIVFLFFSNSWIPDWLAIVCVLLPLFFVMIYMYFFYRLEGADIVFLGKSLFSGREDVYSAALENINTPFQVFFGNYTKARLNNAHNAPLTVFTSFGIYGLTCFYSIMIPVVFRVKTHQKSRITTASVACLLGFFVTSCSEAIAFLGTFPGIIYINTFILMANFREPLPEEMHPEIVNMVKDSKVLQRVLKHDDGGEK